MQIGQMYADMLTPGEQKALQASCDILIDSVFDEFEGVDGPKEIAMTTVGGYLPRRYLSKYGPLFFKQFAVCLITVAWKLAQPQQMPLSSLAEELAARTIIEHAKVVMELDGVEEDREEAFETFEDVYFEDTDFEFLFDDEYDGIDETQLAQTMGLPSLAFDDWFKPFSDEPSRTAHPYVL
jgi:hypothetical protein